MAGGTEKLQLPAVFLHDNDEARAMIDQPKLKGPGPAAPREAVPARCRRARRGRWRLASRLHPRPALLQQPEGLGRNELRPFDAGEEVAGEKFAGEFHQTQVLGRAGGALHDGVESCFRCRGAVRHRSRCRGIPARRGTRF